LDAEDVVVGREHVHGGRISGLHGHRDLSVVNAREVASTSWLVLFWLKREGVRVHTWVWAARVVVVRLDLVEVLTLLFLESVLAVEDKLESGKWAGSFFGEVFGGSTGGEEWDTGRVAQWHVAVGFSGNRARVGFEDNFVIVVVGGEVPQGGSRRGVGEAPDEFLNWVVVGQADLLGGRGGDGVGASVLHLLDEVFVTLLRETTTLFGVKVDIVTPDLEGVGVTVVGEVRRQINVDADFVVLERNQWQVEAWVAVEEEDEWQIHGVTGSRGGHLGVSSLLGFIQVKLGVQTPPLLVVLVNALATNGKLNVVDRTLSDPVTVTAISGAGVSRSGLEFDVHVTDQITVAGNSDGDAA